MPSLESLTYDYLFCLFKGEPGTRKSTAALSFPKPLYIFDYDQKTDALGLPMRAWGLDPKSVTYDSYMDWNKGKAKLESLQTRCDYKTIVIDSITTMADAINRQTLKIKGAGSGSKLVAGIPVNSVEDFNAEDSALKEMIALLKDIKSYHKVNVILIAHVIQKEIKTLDGKTHMSRTLLTAGKGIAAKIPAYCSEVYHFNVKEGIRQGAGGEYGMFTIHTGDDFARSSLPLPPHILFNDEPLYDKWIKPAIEVMKKDPPKVVPFGTSKQETK